jgi:hypothetical protein
MPAELSPIGLEQELARVRKAIQQRQSLLILGPRGCGKTTLLRTALGERGCKAIYVESASVLHDLLVGFARSLALAGHRPTLNTIGRASDLDRTLTAQTSVHLKGILWNAIEKEPVVIALDDVQGAGMRNYRFLQRIYHTKGVAIIAAARDYRSLDAVARLFWDPRTIVNVPPLTPLQSHTLFDRLVERFQLCHLDIEEFRDRVLHSARGNAGEIVEMCKLAAQPRYQVGSHVKFAPLRIDAIMRLGALH